MQAISAADMDGIKEELGFCERYAENDPQYMVKSSFSLVDMSVLLTSFMMQRMGAKLAKHPHMKKYADSRKSRPSILGSWTLHAH
jgi:glutathione S-transferase